MALAGLRHLSQLSDSRLLEATAALVRQRDSQTALVVAHLAVIAARKAYRPLGYSSLHLYCVQALHLSEHSAYKHVWAVRFARRFPPVLDAIAEGRVHLAGVCELARRMTPENATELLEAATHRTRREILAMLAERFPKPDLPTLVMALPDSPEAAEQAASPTSEPQEVKPATSKLAPGQVSATDAMAATRDAAGSAPAAPAPARVAPLAPGRFALQVTIGQHAHDLLRRAQELLAHARPGCDVEQVLELALAELVRKLDQRKYGETDSRRARRGSTDSKHVPAEVRRQVAERDEKRCTFVSDTGVRCAERALLEFDHEIPVARGGRSTLANVRLRCRAHNQLAAEQVYGEGFMREKREHARAPRSEAAAGRAAGAAARSD